MAEFVKKIAKTVWTHRVAYGALAAAYGAGCSGLVDKDIVMQVATGIYVGLAAQAH